METTINTIALVKAAGLTKRALSDEFMEAASAARYKKFRDVAQAFWQAREEARLSNTPELVDNYYKIRNVLLRTPRLEGIGRYKSILDSAKSKFDSIHYDPEFFARAVTKEDLPNLAKGYGFTKDFSGVEKYREKALAKVNKMLEDKPAAHAKMLADNAARNASVPQSLPASVKDRLMRAVDPGLLGGVIGAATNDGNRAAGAIGGGIGGALGTAGMNALAGKIGLKGVGSTLANLAAAGAGGYGGGKLGAKLDQHFGNPVTTGVNSAIGWAGDKGNQAISWLKDKLGLGGK